MSGVEVPGLNPGKFVFKVSLCVLEPVVTALLAYVDPRILHSFGLCFISL